MSDALTIAAMTPGQKRALAVASRNVIWRRRDLDEDSRIDMLNKACTELMLGDKAAGLRLSREVLWS